jgi:hypothetical protein
MAGAIDVPFAQGAQSGVHGPHPAFPWGMKDWFILFNGDRPETVHATHVMYAVH